MYDDLVKRLRASVDGRYEKCDVCPYEEDYPCCVDCLDKMHKEAADAIEELSKSPWIPVTERLPEIEEDVLIAATVHTKKGDVRAVTGDFINTAGQWNGASCSWRYEVTHWMPLPEPPKEEDDVQG